MSYKPTDSTVIDASTNPVEGNAVYDALALKAPLASPTFTGVSTLGGEFRVNVPAASTAGNISATGRSVVLLGGNCTLIDGIKGQVLYVCTDRESSGTYGLTYMTYTAQSTSIVIDETQGETMLCWKDGFWKCVSQ